MVHGIIISSLCMHIALTFIFAQHFQQYAHDKTHMTTQVSVNHSIMLCSCSAKTTSGYRINFISV